jgi:hypothetical protein
MSRALEVNMTYKKKPIEAALPLQAINKGMPILLA